MEIRPATLDDVDRLAAFMGSCTLAHQGVRRDSANQMRQRLTKPVTDPALDTWLVEDHGEVVGFAQVWREDQAVVCYVRVDPEHAGLGIAARSSRADGTRSRARDAGCRSRDELAEGRGGGAAPRDGGVPAAALPLPDDDRARQARPDRRCGRRDVLVRVLDDDSDLHPIHQAQQEALSDRLADFDNWLHEYEKSFDPSLWFVAEDDAGIAASRCACRSSLRIARRAMSASSAVRPDRRGQGLL